MVVAVDTASFMRELYINGIVLLRVCGRLHVLLLPRYCTNELAEVGHIVRLEFPSHFDMLDVVQILSDHMGQLGQLDEDSTHWVGVAVRESVINAIKHGNGEDEDKRVVVEFEFEPSQLIVRVVDQGEGFDPGEVVDPLAPENLLKSSGRGIFFMRNFMDDLTLQPGPQGGTEVRMVKKFGPPDD